MWENEFHSDKTIDVQKTKPFIEGIVLHSPIRIEYRIYYTAKNSEVLQDREVSEELTDFLYSIYKNTGGRFGAKINTSKRVA